MVLVTWVLLYLLHFLIHLKTTIINCISGTENLNVLHLNNQVTFTAIHIILAKCILPEQIVHIFLALLFVINKYNVFFPYFFLINCPFLFPIFLFSYQFIFSLSYLFFSFSSFLDPFFLWKENISPKISGLVADCGFLLLWTGCRVKWTLWPFWKSWQSDPSPESVSCWSNQRSDCRT